MKRYVRLLVLVAVVQARGAPACADDQVDHGRYLATIAACLTCHTARTPGAPMLAGGSRFGSGTHVVVSANITPDDETGIGRWSTADIVTALHDMRRPDGSPIRPPMPQRAYRGLTAGDAAAIAAFLKSVPPVHHEVAIDPPKIEARPSPAESLPADPKRTRGRYLFASVTHCGECHAGPGDADVGRGKSFAGRNGPVVAPALTPDRLASLSDAELSGLITAGRRPDGSTLDGPMPVSAYSHLRFDDLSALITYLRHGK